MIPADILPFVSKKEDESVMIVGESQLLNEVLHTAKKVAGVDSTILIMGESGTGKELIAKVIHLNSLRKNKPFIAVNCSAIPDTLFESLIFGHTKGAFTGAISNQKGYFRQADGGTIFLDEISEMSLSVQAKLLRVLEVRQFHPVGREKPVDIDVRVIVATNKDLKKEVKNGRFRDDLFYRINVIPIHLPSLRERKEDIPILAKYFLKKYSQEMKKEVHDITPGALQKLIFHDWPGNVRELINTIEYAVAMTTKNVITEEVILLPEFILATNITKGSSSLEETIKKAKMRAILKAVRVSKNSIEAARILEVQRTYLFRLIRDFFNCTFTELKKIL